jgi:tRNA-modifying protein YgfZ
MAIQAHDFAAKIAPLELASLVVHGPDCAAFLHGQLSCDLTQIAPSQWALGAYCAANGKVIVSLLVACLQTDKFCLVMPRSQIASVQKRLRMFVLRSRVDMEEHGFDVWAGDASFNVPSPTVTAMPLRTTQEGLDALDQQGNVVLRLSQSAVSPHTSNVEIDRAWARNWWKHKWPWIELAQSGQFLPHALGLPSFAAISLKKGCYPGQEIIARTHYLGKSKRFCLSAWVNGHPIAPFIVMTNIVEPSESTAACVSAYSGPNQTALILLETSSDVRAWRLVDTQQEVWPLILATEEACE